jgi:hypothetical protein
VTRSGEPTASKTTARIHRFYQPMPRPWGAQVDGLAPAKLGGTCSAEFLQGG